MFANKNLVFLAVLEYGTGMLKSLVDGIFGIDFCRIRKKRIRNAADEGSSLDSWRLVDDKRSFVISGIGVIPLDTSEHLSAKMRIVVMYVEGTVQV